MTRTQAPAQAQSGQCFDRRLHPPGPRFPQDSQPPGIWYTLSYSICSARRAYRMVHQQPQDDHDGN
jgi:hypothetical protein